MSEAALERRGTRERILALVREAVGLIGGGVLGAIAWMIVSHEALNRGWNDQDFSRALGEILGATDTDVPRLGLWVGLAIGAGLAIAILPISFRLIPGSWWLRSLPLILVSFALWGFWFSPLAGEKSSYSGGLFGSDAGADELITYAITAFVYGTVAGRVYSVMASAGFWRPKDNDLRGQGAEMLDELLEDRTQGAASLELPEERPRERGKAPEA